MTRWRMGQMAMLAIAVTACLFQATVSHAERKTLALFNLRPVNIEAMGYNSDILFTLASILDGKPGVDIMQRRRMEDSLYQAGMGQSDEPDSVVEAGRALGVAFVLFGRVRHDGASVHADLRLMDVRAGEEAGDWQLTIADRDAITARVERWSTDLIAAMTGAGGPAPAPSPSAVPVSAASPSKPDAALPHFTAQSQGPHVALTWRAPVPESIIGYHVYRGTNADGPFQLLGQSPEPKYSDTTARAGLTYFYQIGLIADSGSERRATPIASVAHTAERRPHPPLILGVDGFVRRVKIRFVPSLINEQQRFTITAYKVYRRDAAEGEFKAVTNAETVRAGFGSDPALSIVDQQGLADGNTYVYVLTSVDADGLESSYSDPVTATVIARPVLTVRQDRLLRRVEFDIGAVPGATGYRLYRRRASGGEFARVGRTRSGDGAGGLVDKRDLEDGTAYEYYLSAADDVGETGASESVTAHTKVVPPPPSEVTAESGLVKAVRLTWAPVADPDVGGYAVYRGTGPNDQKRIKRLSGHDTRTYVDKGNPFVPLKDGTTYLYRVKSYNRFDAEGDASNQVSAATKPRPAAVAGVTAALAGGEAQVTWRPNTETDITTYQIYRQKNDGFWSSQEKVDGRITAWTDSRLTPNSRYRYRIIAVDADNLESDSAESGTLEVPAAKP